MNNNIHINQTRTLSVIAIAILALLLNALASALGAVPGIINYQGRVTVDGTNFTGTGWFSFQIHDGINTFWSTPTTGAVPIEVNGGLFSANLGDTSVSNMTSAIPPSVFTQSNVYLQVSFSADGTNFTTLSPSTRFTANGYALNAANAESVSAGAVTSSSIANNSITATHLATNIALATSANISSGGLEVKGGSVLNGVVVDINGANSGTINSNTALVFGGLASGEGVASTRTSGANVNGLDLYTGGRSRLSIFNSGTVAIPGYLGIGATNVQRQLDVESTADRMARFKSSANAGTWLQIQNTTSGGNTWDIIATGQGNGEGAGHLALYDENSGTMRMLVKSNGNVGIGTTSPSAKLDVNGAVKASTLDVNGSVKASTIEVSGTVKAATLTIGNNTASGNYGAIGGGNGNTTGLGSGDVIAGGEYNQINSSADHAFIGGGDHNVVGSNANNAVINGGYNNTNTGSHSATGGGSNNRNGGSWGTIAGGFNNVISNNTYSATIPGGEENTVGGSYSLAAGRRANALHTGAFVWADNTSGSFSSSADNQFIVRASGGVGIGTNAPASALHVVGTVTADRFSGNASGLTNIPAASLTGAISSSRIPAGAVNTLGTPDGSKTNVINVSNSGYVGIGTNSPQTKLEVNGDIRSSGAVIAAFASTNVPEARAGFYFGNATSGDAIIAEDATTAHPFSLDFLVAGSERMTITAEGKVGIGVSSPDKYLEVVGDVKSGGTVYGDAFSGNTLYGNNCYLTNVQSREVKVSGGLAIGKSLTNRYDSGVGLYFGGIGAGEAILSQEGTAPNPYGLDFFTLGSERMTITSGGNVGIGTTTPTTALQVNGTVTATSFSGAFGGTFTGNASALTNLVVDPNAANTGSINANNTLLFGGTTSGEGIGSQRSAGTGQYGLDFYTSSSRRMTIALNGRVGIGVVSPAAALHVSNSVQNALQLDGASTSGTWLNISNSAGGRVWNIISTGSGNSEGPGKLLIRDDSAGVRMTFSTNGFVGIGTNTPGERLEVLGNIRCTGTVTANGSVLTSDRNLKKDIAPLGDSLGKVMALKPATYRFKTEAENEAAHVGFIAQEVQELFPDAVKQTGDHLALSYTDLSVAGIKALQELKREKDAEISTLKQQIAELKTLLQAK